MKLNINTDFSFVVNIGLYLRCGQHAICQQRWGLNTLQYLSVTYKYLLVIGIYQRMSQKQGAFLRGSAWWTEWNNSEPC